MKQNLALILSLGALTLAVGSMVRNSGQESDPGISPASTQAPNAIQSPQPVALSTQPAPPQLEENNNAGEEMIRLLTDIQGRLDRVEQTFSELKPGWDGLARRGLVPLSEEYHASLRQQVLNSASAARDKLEAYKLLRRHRKVTDDIAMAMIDLANTSTDPKIQAEALASLDGITNPVVKPALLTTLSDSLDPKLRERAADALSAFSNDPDVEAWLRHVAQTDENEEVRKEARSGLYERFARMDQDSLHAITLDANTPPDEKVAALSRMSNEKKDSQVMWSMIDLYSNIQDPGIKADILRRTDGITDPDFKAPLMNWLANEPDPRSRGEAAENLKHFRDDPMVKSWLEHAAANDESSIVRRAASAALQGRDPR